MVQAYASKGGRRRLGPLDPGYGGVHPDVRGTRDERRNPRREVSILLVMNPNNCRNVVMPDGVLRLS